jgi:hypothetical protein
MTSWSNNRKNSPRHALPRFHMSHDLPKGLDVLQGACGILYDFLLGHATGLRLSLQISVPDLPYHISRG